VKTAVPLITVKNGYFAIEIAAAAAAASAAN